MNNTICANKRVSENCLSLIRIIAACQVMFGHIYEHLELQANGTLIRTTHFFRGVPIFFILSGYLIWCSVNRSKSYGQYLKKRFWRIYPELWVAVAIEIIVLIVLYHKWSLKQLVLFIFAQASIFQFWTPDSLRGYGVGTPNGALWTIGVMIQFYIIAWFFYLLMKNRSLITWIIGFVLSFLVSFLCEYLIVSLIKIDILEKLYSQTFIKYFWLFYIGMFIAQFKDVVLPILKKFWYFFVIVSFFFFWTSWDLFAGYYLLWSALLGAGLIGFAYCFPKLSIKIDVSYGLFLYHMTVVNVFVNFGWIGRWIYIVPIVVISVLLALISTVTIGRLSSNKKKHLIV